MWQKRIKMPWILAIVLIGFVGCQSNQSLVLVKNGRSNYHIVIPDNSDTTIENAALELQKYLGEMTSVNLPILKSADAGEIKKKIEVGNNLTDNLNKNTVAVFVKDEDLVITGGSSESTLYAVYEFLENQAGCRWYSPDAEKIPFHKIINIDCELIFVYTPEITTRTVHSRLFYDHPDFAAKQKVTTDAFPGYVPTARVHTFHRFLPESDFYKKHPEYYALRGNKRLPTQLCLTNPEVVRLVTDSVAAYFERFPDANVISVSQDDNTLNCQCENCRKVDEEEGSPSGTMIRFVNAVAAHFPDKTISTLAYQYTRKPPKTKPVDNVLITLCSIECDRSAPIEEKCTDFAEDLMGWKEKTENIRIWDYTTQFTNFLAPFPNITTLQPNIQFFRENNARWIFEQHSYNPSELFELRSYLTAKLLWNPDLDVDETITDFTNGYYEEGGIFVKKYIDLIHEEIKKDSTFFLFLYGDPSQAFNSFLKPELLEKYNGYFNQAEEAVKDKPIVIQRVRTARLSIDYAILEAARKGLNDHFRLIVNDKPAANVVSVLNRFRETCANAEITLMNEMGYTVEEYLAGYEKTLHRALIPDVAKGKKVTLLTKPKKYAGENPQVLTDGSFGGTSFYANWLGFERNNLEAVIDLGSETTIDTISVGFLQVTNHIVFFPENVTFYVSTDNKTFKKVATVSNARPLSPKSKVNDIQQFVGTFPKTKARFIKVVAVNRGTAPVWHNAAGSPAWIFADEVIIN